MKYSDTEDRIILDRIMDKYEKKLNGSGLWFSQRHRLRWWAVRAIKFWIQQNKREKVEFT